MVHKATTASAVLCVLVRLWNMILIDLFIIINIMCVSISISSSSSISSSIGSSSSSRSSMISRIITMIIIVSTLLYSGGGRRWVLIISK